MKTIDFFTTENGSYNVQKTIMNKLIPVGKTLENIKKNGIVEADIELEENANTIKKLITDYHKQFIENNLNFELDFTDLYELIQNYKSETDRQKKNEILKEIKKLQDSKRQEITANFKKNKNFKSLFTKDMIEELLFEIATEEEKNLLKSFKGFTSYFTDFNKTKEKIYESEEKHNTIAYRIVNDNFNIFTSNSFILKNIDSSLFEILKTELKNKINESDIEKLSDPASFSKFFSQKGIDYYNLFIGGYSEENIKHKGLNEIINEKSEKKFKLKKLQKMILSDSTSFSFAFSKLSNTDELISELENFGENNNMLIKEIEELFSRYNEFDLSKIYVNYKNLNKLSNIVFGNFNILTESLKLNFRKQNKNIKNKAKYEKLEKEYLQQEYFSLYELQKIYEDYAKENNYSITEIKLLKTYFIHNSFLTLNERYNILSSNFDTWKKTNTNLIQNEKGVNIIKNYLDAFLEIYNYFKIIEYKGFEESETKLYDIFSIHMEQLKDIISLYNRTRNFLTQKLTYSKKIQLNFNSMFFCSSWDYDYIKNKNYTFILRKNDKYYLGILNKNSNINIIKETDNKTDGYEFMFYKQMVNPSKNLPRIIFAKSNKELFNPSEEFTRKYKENYHLKSSPNFDINFCHEYIDFCKSCLAKYESSKIFDMKFSDTSTYTNVSDFYKEIENQSQKIWFENISSEFIDSNVENGNIYLFEIYNKRMNSQNKDTQTLMFEYIFSKENLENVLIKLKSGKIYFRPAKFDLESTPVHKKGSILVNKIDKNGKHIDNDLYKEIYLYLNKKTNNISEEAQELLDNDLINYRTATYDIVKNKRYTEDSFILHLSIVLNKTSELENEYLFNERVLEKISDDESVNIMGINRGERNLIYITIIDQKGNVLKTESLNIIEQNKYNGNKVKIDYLSKLKDKSYLRNKEKQNWLQIENIKELKEGYLSQAISRITNLMIEYNSIIVLEKLSKNFKNKKTSIDFSIYEKFEKMLINKLNCLILHNKKADEKGGILNPYQLTPNTQSLDNIYFQCGWIFFLNAGYISKTDPKTGFTNLFNTFEISNFKKKKEFLSLFKSIKYDENLNAFKYSFSYSDFGIDYPTDNWNLYTYQDRTYFDKNKNKYITINLNEELISNLNGTIYYKEELIDFIKECPDEKKYYQIIDSIFRIFNLTIKMNNYEDNDNYFISPVYKNDNFFDSRKDSILTNNDSIASYNLANKMKYYFEKGFKNEKNKAKLLTNEEWFNYLNS